MVSLHPTVMVLLPQLPITLPESPPTELRKTQSDYLRYGATYPVTLLLVSAPLIPKKEAFAMLLRAQGLHRRYCLFSNL